MNKISVFIANLGQNIQFVAFCAHLGIAALITEHSGHKYIVGSLILVYAVIKEFYFDAKYEKNPPQIFIDNFEDFVGYGIGAVLGMLLGK